MRNLPLRLCLALIPSVLLAQPFFNLDFEVSTRNRLRGWTLSVSGFEMGPDTTTAVSGKQSLRIKNTGAASTALAPLSQLLPIDLVRGKTVKYSGYIKTEAVTPGYAALWLRVDGASGYLTLDNMSQYGPRGTTGWAKFEIERQIRTEGMQAIFGVFLSGGGTAWFDNLQIEIDGVPIKQVEPFAGEPTTEQLDWIKSNAIPFRTPDAGSGFDDLQPLKQVIGSARIVGLGEASHGTSEFFRMKHRLLEFLASEMGFTIFSIEANMPEAYKINDYVLAGRGDPKALLKGMYFWTWNTQEVLDMIEWMRAFNASGRGRVQFTGFDMQTGTVAADIVRQFVDKADPKFSGTVQEAYRTVSDARVLAQTSQNFGYFLASAWAARDVREHLEANYDHYVTQATMAEVDWAIQNARVVEQSAFTPIGGSSHRDEMMALNTGWILDQNPGAKAVLWAHNYHVSRVPLAQGSFLASRYKSDYVVLGFAFHQGRYNAVNMTTGRLGPADATVSYPGSVEYMFHNAGIPRFILDLRKARVDNQGAWLLSDMEFREIGAVVTDGFAVRTSLCSDYDALIFFDTTAPSALL